MCRRRNKTGGLRPDALGQTPVTITRKVEGPKGGGKKGGGQGLGTGVTINAGGERKGKGHERRDEGGGASSSMGGIKRKLQTVDDEDDAIQVDHVDIYSLDEEGAGETADDQSIGQIRRPTFLPQQGADEVAEEDGYEDYGSAAGGIAPVGGLSGDRNDDHETRSQTSVLSSQRGTQSGWGVAPRVTRAKSGPYGGTITPGATAPYEDDRKNGRRTWAEQTEVEEAQETGGVVTPHATGARTTTLERMMQEMAKV